MADCLTRGLDKLRIGQPMDWTARRLVNSLAGQLVVAAASSSFNSD